MPAWVKESIRFPSADGDTLVAGFFYSPPNPRGVVQLSHGMCEYVERYEDFISLLVAAGFAVCGNDHLGHGSTSPNSLGFLAEENGYRFLLEDLHTMNRLGHEKYPALPYFLLGHSMGSFFARWYGEKWPDTIDGLILSGTGGPSPLMSFGKTLSSLLARVRGPKYVSPFLVKCSMGSYCRRIPDATSGNAWLSRDPAVWEKYAQDEKCNFSFSVSAYRDMLTAYVHVSTAAWAQSLPKELPVYLYSGDADPVGNYGKGVMAVYALLQEAGLQDVSCKLYPGGRHEMHNETNRQEVFADLLAWLEAHL